MHVWVWVCVRACARVWIRKPEKSISALLYHFYGSPTEREVWQLSVRLHHQWILSNCFISTSSSQDAGITGVHSHTYHFDVSSGYLNLCSNWAGFPAPWQDSICMEWGYDIIIFGPTEWGTALCRPSNKNFIGDFILNSALFWDIGKNPES